MLSLIDALLFDCLDGLAAGVLNPFNLFSLSLFGLNLSWWANITCKTDLTSILSINIISDQTHHNKQQDLFLTLFTSEDYACGPAEKGTPIQALETRHDWKTSPAWAALGRAPTWAHRRPGSATGGARWAHAQCSCNKSGQSWEHQGHTLPDSQRDEQIQGYGDEHWSEKTDEKK